MQIWEDMLMKNITTKVSSQQLSLVKRGDFCSNSSLENVSQSLINHIFVLHKELKSHDFDLYYPVLTNIRIRHTNNTY